MNREKVLFLAIAAITVLWAGSRLASPYQPGKVPNGRRMEVEVPNPETHEDLAMAVRLLQGLIGVDDLDTAVPESGRTPMVRHSDLVTVEAADLEPPRPRSTPVVLPPIDPFPSVTFYRQFRADAVMPVKGAPDLPDDSGYEEPIDEDEGEDEEEAIDEEKVLEERQKWRFVATEWDRLTLSTGEIWYGTISLKKEQRDQGHTKYDLLRPNSRELVFLFEKINSSTGRRQTKGEFTLEASNIARVEFADNIANRYYGRRAVQDVAKGDVPGLLALGRWTMELADEPAYDRMKGLELAAAAFKEAVDADPGNLECVLALGEALHRAFRYDEELGLYDKAIAEKEAAPLFVRRARIFRKLGLTELEEQALSRAVELAPGDVRARYLRGEALYRLGRPADAEADFVEVVRTGDAEEQLAAREGRARCLLAQGNAEGAVSLLASAEDARSLVTLGAARYALKDWAGATEAFEKAAVADPLSAPAMTALGFAKAQSAEAWADIDAALDTLEKARGLDPLNYFWPPLGMGFAEQRRGSEGFTASVDHYLSAEMALPTKPYVHYILGYSYLRDGRAEEARAEFQKALDLDYRFVDALIGAGTAAMELQDWSGARSYLRRALTLETRAYEEHGEDAARKALVLLNYRLGRALILSTDLPEANRLKDAQALFSVILEPRLDPNFVPALEALAYLSYMLGDSEMAKQYFDQASDLAPEGSTERTYAEEQKAKIIDAESRARWSDDFNRPDSSKVGNEWLQTNQGAMTPTIRGDEVVVEGRAQESTPIWLTRSGRKWELLKNFLSAQAVVELKKKDDLNFRYFVFTRKGDNTLSNAVGIERNARGNVALITWKANENSWEREPLKDAAGAPLVWPEGKVEVEIVRTDAKKGIFAVFMGGERVGEINLGLRARPGALDIGFQFQAARGVKYRAAVDDVEIELYR